MNYALKEILINKVKRKFTVAQYEKYFSTILVHINRLCEKDFIDIDSPIKYEIAGDIRISKVADIDLGSDRIILETGFGGIDYFEAMKPTEKELKRFDGHVLIVKEAKV